MKQLKLSSALRDMPVARKFQVLMGMILIGYVLVGVDYFLSLRAEEGTQKVLSGHHEFAADVDKLEIALLQAEEFEVQFLRTGDMSYAQRFDEFPQAALVDLDAVRAETSNERELALLSDLGREMAAYREKFTEITAMQQALGADENSGLLGRLIKAAQLADSDIRQANATPLLASLLQMRVHEKNFIQRDAEIYLQRHAEE